MRVRSGADRGLRCTTEVARTLCGAQSDQRLRRDQWSVLNNLSSMYHGPRAMRCRAGVGWGWGSRPCSPTGEGVCDGCGRRIAVRLVARCDCDESQPACGSVLQTKVRRRTVNVRGVAMFHGFWMRKRRRFRQSQASDSHARAAFFSQVAPFAPIPTSPIRPARCS